MTKPPVVTIYVDSSPMFFEASNPEAGDTPEESPTWAEVYQAAVGRSTAPDVGGFDDGYNSGFN